MVRFLWILFCASGFIAPQNLWAASVLPADRLEIQSLPVLSDCGSTLLSSDESQLQSQIQYKLKIKGTVLALSITADEKSILETLMASEQPIRDFQVAEAQVIIAKLNSRAIQTFNRSIILQNAGAYSLHRQNQIFEDAPSTARKKMAKRQDDLHLTPKQNLFLETVMSALNQQIKFEDLARAMNWHPEHSDRNRKDYLWSINRHFIIRYGIPLFEANQDVGVRVYRGKLPEVSNASEMRMTSLGSLSLDRHALKLSKLVDLTAIDTTEKLLRIPSSTFEKLALGEPELLDLLNELNRKAIAAFGEALFTQLELEVRSFQRPYYWVHRHKIFRTRKGWHSKSLTRMPELRCLGNIFSPGIQLFVPKPELSFPLFKSSQTEKVSPLSRRSHEIIFRDQCPCHNTSTLFTTPGTASLRARRTRSGCQSLRYSFYEKDRYQGHCRIEFT